MEENETFAVVLSATNPSVILDLASATTTILDDSCKLVVILMHACSKEMSLHHTLHCSPPVVTVGLEQSSYMAVESNGSVTVCAILTGQIERDVSVSLSTMDGSAESMFSLIQVHHNILY